jgi:hypothetical protein
MSTTGTKETAAPTLAVTQRFREALSSLRMGLGDMATGLQYASVEGHVADGIVRVIATLRELELLDDDVERMEALFEQHRVDTAAERQAQVDEMTLRAFRAELDRQGLAVVPKARVRSSRRLRSVS